MITCQKCHHQNPPDSRFCLQCAAALGETCPSCSHQLPAGSRFCNLCGSPINPSAAEPRPSIPEPYISPANLIPAANGERREITVLFLDFANFTAFAHEQDAEDVYLMIDEVMKLLVEIIANYEGVIDKFTGDGLLALFGVRTIHENDPERAVRAALEIVEQLRPIQNRIFADHNFKLQLRIGIHTGEVIAGKIGSELHAERTVIGDTVNIASRLESAAEPDTVLVSQATYRQTRPVFHFQVMPPIAIKGKPEPAPVFRPLKLRQKRGQVRGIPGLKIPMVGRHTLLRDLSVELANVHQTNRARFVVVKGDAGVGKSRLVQEFCQRGGPSEPSFIHYSGSCQTHKFSRPYWVFADLLRNLIGLVETEPAEQQLERLSTYLSTTGLSLAETLPYLAYLLDIIEWNQQMAQQIRRLHPDMLQRLVHAAVRQLLVVEADFQPPVLILDDLHWVDGPSWDLLLFLLEAMADHPVLFILITRDDHPTLLAQLDRLTSSNKLPGRQLQLKKLSLIENRLLVDRLIPQSTTDAEAIKEAMVARAEGNPFYTEELVRMLMDEGGIVKRNGSWYPTPRAGDLLQRVPGTLQGLILARFDSLEAEVQGILCRAATLGKSFSGKLLSAILKSAGENSQNINQLNTRQFLDVIEGSGDETFYTFRHTLIQDTIYSTLLKRDKQLLHAQISETLENNPDLVPRERQELLAYHFARSGEPQKAIPYLFNVAESAAQQFANEAAAGFYQQILDLVGRNEKDQNYLQAQTSLAGIIKRQGRYEDATRMLNQAMDILSRPQFELDETLGEQLEVNTLRELADIRQREGGYEDAALLLEKGLARLGSPQSESQVSQYRALIERLVFVLFRQGRLDDALAMAKKAISTSSLDKDLVTITNLFNHLGGISWQQGNSAQAIFYVEQSQQRYRKLGYTQGIANCYNNLGILYAQSGDWSQAVENWTQALEIYERIGDVQHQAVGLSNLAQMHLTLGQHGRARRQGLQGLALAARLGSQYQTGKLYLILAQLDLAQGNLKEAQESAIRALNLALETGSEDLHIEARWIQALIYGEGQDLPAGLALAAEALQTAQKMGLMEREAQCCYVQGVLKGKAGEITGAESDLRQAEELFSRLADAYWQGKTLLGLGNLYLDLLPQDPGRYGAAADTALEEAGRLLTASAAEFELKRVETARDKLTKMKLGRE